MKTHRTPGINKTSSDRNQKSAAALRSTAADPYICMATIDVGAHSARLLIAQVNRTTCEFSTLEELEQSVPLGSDVFRKGSISDESIRILSGILLNYREKMDEYGVVHYKAIATSAVREAENSAIFLERIRHATSISIELFSGTDEARLDYKAVASGMTQGASGFTRNRTLIADIGTGACQVSAFDHGKLCFTETLKVGTLRSLEQIHGTYNAGTLNYYTALSVDRVFGELQVLAENFKSALIIAMGTSPRVLLRLFPGKQNSSGPVVITREEFFLLRSTLSDLSYEQICEQYLLRTDLAEMVQVCCMILENLLRLTDAKKILIPMVSTKFLLLMDFIEKTFALPDRFEEQMEHLIIRTARRYHCDDDYCRRTVRFAEVLFDKLSFLHGLTHREKLLLGIASRLHKCGLFINNQAYHKHSAYIIANTEIPGISARERSIASLVARYHRKSPPKALHPEYMSLPMEEREVVNKLSALLRIACALAHFAPGPENLTVKTGEGSVTLLPGDDISCFPESVTEADKAYFRSIYACRILFA